MAPANPKPIPTHQPHNPPRPSYQFELRPGQMVDLFIVFSNLLVLVSGWLTFRYVMAGRSVGAVLLILTGVFILLNIIVYRREAARAVVALQTVLFVLTIWSFLSGGIGYNGWFWILLFPFVTFFLQGYARGKSWNLGLVMFVTIATLGEVLGVWALPYPAETTLLYAVLFFFMLSLAFLSNFQISRQLSFISHEAEHERHLEKILARDKAGLLSIGDGLVATDASGRITVVNHAFEHLLGRTSTEVVGQLFTSMVPMRDAAGNPAPPEERLVTKIVTGKISKTTSITTRQQYQRNDGSWFPVILTVSPIVIDDQVTGAVEVFRDITKEEALERTKSEFVSVASHQLQTPLSAIGWLTELLLSNVAGRLTARQQSVVKKIDQSNMRMVEIVNSLLNASRAELGTFMVTPEPTDLAKLSRDVVNEAKVNPPHRVTVIEDYDRQLPKIPVDPLLMRMIMQNLVSNALRYTPDNGRVTVRLTHDARSITLEVTDSGIGIPSGSRDLIFLKFYRAPNATRLLPEGIGLGLYLVKHVIDISGGTITFTSTENQGTTFQVRFPLSGMRQKAGIRRLTASDGNQSLAH